jgi:hypothetical protein
VKKIETAASKLSLYEVPNLPDVLDCWGFLSEPDAPKKWVQEHFKEETYLPLLLRGFLKRTGTGTPDSAEWDLDAEALARFVNLHSHIQRVAGLSARQKETNLSPPQWDAILDWATSQRDRY